MAEQCLEMTKKELSEQQSSFKARELAIESEYEQLLTERKVKIEGLLEETKGQSKRNVVLEGELHR